MDTAKLKKFAQNARRNLMEQVSAKIKRVMDENSAARRELPKAVEDLEKAIKESSKDQVVEKVAYTWFNRFCALRFMDVNRYTRIGVVSPAEGQLQPEILAEAKMGHMDENMVGEKTGQKVFALLDGKEPSPDPQGEAYRLLLVAACNYWHGSMPFMFERINDYTELLMPDDLLSENALLDQVRNALTSEACGIKTVESGEWEVGSKSDSSHSTLPTSHSAAAGGVEVIGWLYQFYISEKKDAVFDGLKKNKKITPENIPAATQLFTPHWIVKYLVENSLGRLWMLNRPASKLTDQMDYYIEPVESGEWEVGSKSQKPHTSHSTRPTSHLRISSPEEIRICDPACGSGHMLTYAFDLLHAIYEEEGYEPSEIPEKILTHNLYGIEIDDRAGALAAFALTMKARSKQRRFFRKKVLPNICVLENVHFGENELKDYMDFIGRDLFTERLLTTLHQFKEADNFGSLIRPALTDVAWMAKELESKDISGQLFLHGTYKKVMTVLDQADYLSPKYHVVVANPPYMGSKGMNGQLSSWAKDNYPNSKSDLYAIFIERIIDMVLKGGIIGLMTPFTWMFLSSYEKLRNRILNENSLLSLVRPEYHAFFESAYVPICSFTLFTNSLPEYHGAFIDLTEFYGADLQPDKTLEAINNPSCGWFYRASSSDFKKIPGGPIAYWVSPKTFELFKQEKTLGKKTTAKQGLATGDNDTFARLWYEVDFNNFYTKAQSCIETATLQYKWYPYNKGGQFRKWFGNIIFVVNWQNDGALIRQFRDEKGKLRSRPQNTQCYFQEGITWSDVTSGYLSARYLSSGNLYDISGHSAFPNSDKERLCILAYLNTTFCQRLAKILNPTLHFQIGDYCNLPFPSKFISTDIEKKSLACVEISKHDWESFETTWDFGVTPLLKSIYRQITMKTTYQKLSTHWQEITLEMQRLEEENNRIFIEAYGLQDELTPEVPLKEITLTCNPHYRYGVDECEVGSGKWEEMEARLLQDTMKEFVSYAVGCMFGRYSLDMPGLVLANQGETLADYVRKVENYKKTVGEKTVESGEWEVGSKNQDLSTSHFPLHTGATERSDHVEGKKLQGSDRLAEVNGLGGNGLSGNQGLPEGGVVRADQPDSPGSGIDSLQYCGGTSQTIDSRVQELSVDSAGLPSGSGNATDDRTTPGLSSTTSIRAHSEFLRGNQTHAPLPDSEAVLTPHSPLPTSHFLPDDDNVIPILDGEWFTDDIVARFRTFLKITFGEDHYEENLAFIEQAIGKNLRTYFIKDFYTDHVKRYKKRPIYWLFSSPKGSFNALIYMHRYRPDTVSVVLNDYLREFRTKLTATKENLESLSISATASKAEKTKALKEIDKIGKMISETEEYERDVLFPLATQQITIDLDDGVKANYPKFGTALKKIAGLEAKEDE